MAFPTERTPESCETIARRISGYVARIDVRRIPRFCAFLGSKRCRTAAPGVLLCVPEVEGDDVAGFSANLRSSSLTFTCRRVIAWVYHIIKEVNYWHKMKMKMKQIKKRRYFFVLEYSAMDLLRREFDPVEPLHGRFACCSSSFFERRCGRGRWGRWS